MYAGMSRITDIAEGTAEEMQAYLDELGWNENPFAHPATVDEYVLPSNEDIADITSALQNYTGPILVHSSLSGVGKTTLLRVLLDEFSEDYETVYIGEHNVTPYELVGIVADDLDIGKSSSTKMTENKIENHGLDDVIIGIDEFGLNDPETLHSIQFLNDFGAKVMLTGMTSQWNAIGSLGSEGKAFQRRVSLQVQLDPFSFEQTRKLYQRRVHGVLDDAPDDVTDVSLGPFGEDVLRTIHDKGDAVPAVMVAAMNTLLGLGAYQFSQDVAEPIDEELAASVEYADPHADV
jgi:hypothetical protein